MKRFILGSALLLTATVSFAAPVEHWQVVRTTTTVLHGKAQVPQRSFFGDFGTEAECALAKQDAFNRAVKVMRDNRDQLCGELPACVVLDLLTDYPRIVLSLTSEGVLYGTTDVLTCEKVQEERH